MSKGAWTRVFAAVAVVATIAACSSAGSSPPPAPCDQACKDKVALRGFRETLKVAFNLTLQGKPVGAHDESAPCPMGGKVRIFGTATSNATQGSTFVQLTYEFDKCSYLQKNTAPEESYSMTLSGTVTEQGTIAVQPSATTALTFKSDKMSLVGTVYDPPEDYKEDACAMQLGQDGNQLSGTMCGRTTGIVL